MIKEIILKDRQIEYELQIKAVKNINLRIKADRTIFVSANTSVSEQTIEEFLVSKSEYILKALDHYEELAKYVPKPKNYVDGESFRVFGHDRRLYLVVDRGRWQHQRWVPSSTGKCYAFPYADLPLEGFWAPCLPPTLTSPPSNKPSNLELPL